jgi:hypothetical protein
MAHLEKAMDTPRKRFGTPYNEMSNQQKAKFVFKLVLCILTFGFAFPNVMGE